MTNTEELDAVTKEFSMSKYSHYLHRDAELFQEIVDLRKKVNDLQLQLDYHTDGNGYMDYYEY